MGDSEFVTVYVADLHDVEKIVGSKDSSYVEQIERKTSKLNKAEREALLHLINKTYTRDKKSHEHENGDVLLYAFEKILSYVSVDSSAGLEVYADEDEVPELWKLIWEEWDEDSLSLPFSTRFTCR